MTEEYGFAWQLKTLIYYEDWTQDEVQQIKENIAKSSWRGQ